jgi:thiamine biosynthesis lipoprotein
MTRRRNADVAASGIVRVTNGAPAKISALMGGAAMSAVADVLWRETRIARRFRAMNTDVELHVLDPEFVPLMARAASVFARIEARFSRFRADSELCAFKARDHMCCETSPEFRELLRHALRMHRVTRGVFDPAVLPQLEAAGYDRSFERVAPASSDAPTAVTERRSIDEARIDGAAVIAPPGLRLDFGGIGKGYAVDRSARELTPAGDFLISAGGDMYASGRAAKLARLVTDPLDEDELSRVAPRPRARDIVDGAPSTERACAPPHHRPAHRLSSGSGVLSAPASRGR